MSWYTIEQTEQVSINPFYVHMKKYIDKFLSLVFSPFLSHIYI